MSSLPHMSETPSRRVLGALQLGAIIQKTPQRGPRRGRSLRSATTSTGNAPGMALGRRDDEAPPTAEEVSLGEGNGY